MARVLRRSEGHGQVLPGDHLKLAAPRQPSKICLENGLWRRKTLRTQEKLDNGSTFVDEDEERLTEFLGLFSKDTRQEMSLLSPSPALGEKLPAESVPGSRFYQIQQLGPRTSAVVFDQFEIGLVILPL
jgi:hypothetical protein